MGTDVSKSPQARRTLATRCRVLVHGSVDVLLEPRNVDGGRTRERPESVRCADKPAVLSRDKFPDFNAVTRHDQGLTAVQGRHDLPAAIPEFPLCSFPHGSQGSTSRKFGKGDGRHRDLFRKHGHVATDPAERARRQDRWQRTDATLQVCLMLRWSACVRSSDCGNGARPSPPPVHCQSR